MKVIATPLRLGLGASLLLGVAPLAALELILTRRAPWWHLPFRDMGILALGALLFAAPWVYWILNGRKWALKAAGVLATLWSLWAAFDGIRRESPALGFFTVFLITFFVVVLGWIHHEMQRSYFDPDAEWYQGLPDPIPELSCRLEQKECRVSRFDADGAFVFFARASDEKLPDFGKSAKVDLNFSFRDRQFRCTGQPIRVLAGNRGAGFRFVGLTPDMRKELGDYVERLRGQGYVD